MPAAHMKDRCIAVNLPTGDGSHSLEMYTCNKKHCDSCGIRFQCYTEGATLCLDYVDWCKVREQLEWFGPVIATERLKRLIEIGELAEWINAPILKIDERKFRRFKSCTLRHDE